MRKRNYGNVFYRWNFPGRRAAQNERLAPPLLTEKRMKILLVLVLTLCSAAALHADELAAQVLAEVNFARTAPQQYAQIVASRALGRPHREGDRVVYETIRFLEKARPLQPLTRSEGLAACARGHVCDQGAVGDKGHRGTDGSSPWKRMARFGRWSGRVAENIAYGTRDARGIVVALLVDDGVRDRGHRLNIFGSEFREVGIACGPHAGFGAMCVMDFAADFAEGPGEVAQGIRWPVLRF